MPITKFFIALTFPKGMAVLSPSSNLACYSGLEANLFLLFHTTKMSKGFQGTLHVGKIVQTVVVESISQVDKYIF